MNDLKLANGFVYVMESNGLYKIGRCEKVERRMRQYKTTNPSFKLVHIFPVTDDVKAEKKLLDFFKPNRVTGEWHKLENVDFAAIYDLIDEFLAHDPDRIALEKENVKLHIKLAHISMYAMENGFWSKEVFED